MQLFTQIEKLINEHGSSSILRERLLLIKEELAKAKQERADLITKCSQLEKEVSKLRQELDKKHIPEEFTEYMGALFKRDASGNYFPAVYCPRCRQVLWNPEPKVFPYECSNCGFKVMIHENLNLIAEKLNNRKDK